MKKLIYFVVIIIVTATAVTAYFVYFKNYSVKETAVDVADKTAGGIATKDGMAGTVEIPQEILDNKFGFLSGHPGSEKEIASTGARWARPHSGPFVWDMMQRSESAKVDFSYTDTFVKNAQEEELGTLATIFPYADWEQKIRENPEACRVPTNEQFLPEGREKEGKEEFYLPYYRCNPTSWEKYAVWVKAIVERYDGDGTDDMPGLKIPVKYWEISNEPDLIGPEDLDDFDEEPLVFYKEDPEDYAELLKKSYQYIKEADPEAQVLISGAAGGGDWSLKFYRRVFKDKEAINSFDVANVHCISNDSYDSFNVEPYKKMLAEFGIQKPIWVTEAEAVVETSIEGNIEQIKESTEKALLLGAEKIFFTRFSFEPNRDDKQVMDDKKDDKTMKDEDKKFEDEKDEDDKMSEGKPWIDDSLDDFEEMFDLLMK